MQETWVFGFWVHAKKPKTQNVDLQALTIPAWLATCGWAQCWREGADAGAICAWVEDVVKRQLWVGARYTCAANKYWFRCIIIDFQHELPTLNVQFCWVGNLKCNSPRQVCSKLSWINHDKHCESLTLQRRQLNIASDISIFSSLANAITSTPFVLHITTQICWIKTYFAGDAKRWSFLHNHTIPSN